MWFKAKHQKKSKRVFQKALLQIAFNLNVQILTIEGVKIHTNCWDSFPSAPVDIMQDMIVADFYMQLLTCYLQICTYIAYICTYIAFGEI